MKRPEDPADRSLADEIAAARHAPQSSRHNSTASAFMAVAKEQPSAAAANIPQADGVVFIGKGCSLSGEINNCTKVEIQGSFEGRITAESLVVRDGGSLKGEIYADNAEVNGGVEGHIDVRGLLDVRSTGRVEGELAYGRLSVSMGGHIAGQIRTSPAAVAPAVTYDDHVVPITQHAGYLAS